MAERGSTHFVWPSTWMVVLAALATVEPSALAAQERRGPPLPEGVTAEMVERGRALFQGRGFCHTCHGPDGRGLPNLGADLTDRSWRHGDGSYGFLVDRIRRGVPAEASATGIPMPPRGGSRLSEQELRVVAAFVWTLGRRGGTAR